MLLGIALAFAAEGDGAGPRAVDGPAPPPVRVVPADADVPDDTVGEPIATSAAAPPLPTEPPGVRAARLERRHLVRLGVLAGASAVAGGVLTGAGWEDERLRSAGLLTLGWAAVDAGIVAAAWKSTTRPRTAEELRASREFLQLNVGLDVGYLATGVSMGVLGRMDGRPEVEGAGWAVAAQGLGLAVLDAILLAELPRSF